MNRLYKTRDIADLYHVSINTVLNWIYRGKLKAYRTLGGHYRISQQDLESFALLHRQLPLTMAAPVNRFSPQLMLVEVGAAFFAQFRRAAQLRWPSAKTVHARTLFDARFLLERMHPDYIIVHPAFTPPVLVAHCSQMVTANNTDTPLLITLSTALDTSIPRCIKQIEHDVIARHSRHIEMQPSGSAS